MRDNALTQKLETLLNDRALFVEENLKERVEALSFIEFATGSLVADQRTARAWGRPTEAGTWLAKLQELEATLRAQNRHLFDRVRDQILTHAGMPLGTEARRALRTLCYRFTTHRPGTLGALHAGFDGLDALVRGIFLEQPLPERLGRLEEEMIPYQPTPASAVLELIDRMHFVDSDLFCDIGSGPGLVVMLVNLLAGVSSYGIEIDPELCAYAEERARRFGLRDVSFAQGDARHADLRGATVFYLFTPFTGRVLSDMRRRLRQEAATRHIRLCSYGPSTPVISQEPWLRALDENGNEEFRLACFESDATG